MSDLTDKQQVWLNEYLQCWNATEAARRAGYSKPGISGHENLTKPYIQDAISEQLALHVMGANEALARISSIARAQWGALDTKIQLRALELIAKHHGVLRDNVAIIFPPEIERLIKQMGLDLNAVQAEFEALIRQAADAEIDND